MKAFQILLLLLSLIVSNFAFAKVYEDIAENYIRDVYIDPAGTIEKFFKDNQLKTEEKTIFNFSNNLKNKSIKGFEKVQEYKIGSRYVHLTYLVFENINVARHQIQLVDRTGKGSWKIIKYAFDYDFNDYLEDEIAEKELGKTQ